MKYISSDSWQETKEAFFSRIPNYSSGWIAAMPLPCFSISLTNESIKQKHFASQMSYNDFLMSTNWLHLIFLCVCACSSIFAANEKWITSTHSNLLTALVLCVTLNKFTLTRLSANFLTICIAPACFISPLPERFQVYSACFDYGTPAKSERAWKVMKRIVSSFSLIIFHTRGMDLELQSADVLRQGRHMKRLQKS